MYAHIYYPFTLFVYIFAIYRCIDEVEDVLHFQEDRWCWEIKPHHEKKEFSTLYQGKKRVDQRRTKRNIELAIGNEFIKILTLSPTPKATAD